MSEQGDRGTGAPGTPPSPCPPPSPFGFSSQVVLLPGSWGSRDWSCVFITFYSFIPYPSLSAPKAFSRSHQPLPRASASLGGSRKGGGRRPAKRAELELGLGEGVWRSQWGRLHERLGLPGGVFIFLGHHSGRVESRRSLHEWLLTPPASQRGVGGQEFTRSGSKGLGCAFTAPSPPWGLVQDVLGLGVTGPDAGHLWEGESEASVLVRCSGHAQTSQPVAWPGLCLDVTAFPVCT